MGKRAAAITVVLMVGGLWSGTAFAGPFPFGSPPSTSVPTGAFGTVTSVNGTSAAGTCGTGTSGDFELTGFKSTTTYTVDVGSFTSSYVDPGQSSASFTDVCVGEQVGALGTVSGTTVQATQVFIAPIKSQSIGYHGFGHRVEGSRRRS